MRIGRAAMSGLLIVAVMLGALTLGAPTADAVESGAVCPEGILTASNQCEVEGDAPTGGDVCPEPALEDGDECYVLVQPNLICPGDSGLVDGQCVVPTDDEPGDLMCAEGFELDPVDECVRFEAPLPLPYCADEAAVLSDDGSTCTTFGDDPIGLLVCPPDAVENDGGCFELVDRVPVCVVGVLIDGAFCEAIVAPVPGPLVCPDGYGLVSGIDEVPVCVQVFDPTFTCEQGFLVGEQCRIIVPAIPGDGGPFECGFDEIFVPEFDSCFFITGDADFSSGEPTCPDGEVVIFGELCGVEGFGSDIGATCPEGFDPVFIDEVEEIFLEFFECERFEPAVPICPVDSVLGEFGVQCILSTRPTQEDVCREAGTPPACIEISPADFACPAGTTPNGDALDCLSPVDPIEDDGLLTCEPGFDPVDGACVSTVPALEELDCPEGSLNEIDLCEIIGDPPFFGPAMCPIGSLGEPGACFDLVPADEVCPEIAPEGFDGCRRPVERVGGAESCAEGFGLVDGRCIRFVEAVWFCAGREVTHNMILGDSGVGTDGDDVILGTDGFDYIFGRDGRDIVCAGGGDDLVFGGNDRDVIFGEGGDDDIFSGAGNDFVNAGFGDDYIYGAGGADDLRGSEGADIIDGGMGQDRINGGGGSDILRGGNDSDTINGANGSDTCFGGSGLDTIANCENAALVL